MINKIYTIYKLINPTNLEVRYVGVTTRTLNERFYQHLHTARKRRKTYCSKWINSLLIQDITPIIEKIEECTSENWEEREKYWIKYYPNLTNHEIGGRGVIINRTKESINSSAKSKEKKVVQLDKKGNFIKEFKSIKEASIELGFKSNSSISNVLHRNYGTNTAGGYYWFFKENYEKGNYSLRKWKSSVDYNKLKKVYLYDKEGNFLKEYLCLSRLVNDLFSENGRNFYTSCKSALLEKREYKGYYISYEKNEKYKI